MLQPQASNETLQASTHTFSTIYSKFREPCLSKPQLFPLAMPVDTKMMRQELLERQPCVIDKSDLKLLKIPIDFMTATSATKDCRRWSSKMPQNRINVHIESSGDILRKDQLELELHKEKRLIEDGVLREDNPLDVSEDFHRLCEACRRNDLKVCQEMIMEGANINAKDLYDYTPLILVSCHPAAYNLH